MRSFKKIAGSCLILLLFCVTVNVASRYLYESSEETVLYTRKELRETKGSVETLLLGTSLVHLGLDPSVISEELDTVCFNLATEVQPLSGSYYLLKDQIRNNPIKTVFLGVSVSAVSAKTNTLVGRKLAILDRMLSPSVRLEYMLREGAFADWEQFLFYPTRLENILTFGRIKCNIAYKQSDAFQNNLSPETAQWQYRGMGFQSDDTKVYDGKYHAEKLKRSNVWSRERVRQENVEQIRRIAGLCEENGIDLNLVIMPRTREFSGLQGDLADMDAYFEELCGELGIGLFDYNVTACEEIEELLPKECYWDKKHLNREGAARIAGLLCTEYKERNKSWEKS